MQPNKTDSACYCFSMATLSLLSIHCSFSSLIGQLIRALGKAKNLTLHKEVLKKIKKKKKD